MALHLPFQRPRRPLRRRGPHRRHRLLTRAGLAWLAFFAGTALIWLA